MVVGKDDNITCGESVERSWCGDAITWGDD